MHVGVIAAGHNSEKFGSFQMAVARIAHGEDTTGNYLKIPGEHAQIQWGKKLGSDWSVGAGANVSRFKTKAGLAGMLVVDSDSISRGVRLGTLVAFAPNLLGGAVVERSWGHSDGSVFDVGCLCYLPTKDSSTSGLLRLGLT